MIGTLWIANFDYCFFDKDTVLIATKYFQCNQTSEMYITLATPQGITTTWREAWLGNKFDRLEKR